MAMAHMVILSETVYRVTYCPQKCHINPRMSWNILDCLPDRHPDTRTSKT